LLLKSRESDPVEKPDQRQKHGEQRPRTGAPAEQSLLPNIAVVVLRLRHDDPREQGPDDTCGSPSSDAGGATCSDSLTHRQAAMATRSVDGHADESVDMPMIGKDVPLPVPL